MGGGGRRWALLLRGRRLPRVDGRHRRSARPSWGWRRRPTAAATGRWASDGGLFSFGDAVFHGWMGGTRLQRAVVGVVATADGGGHWEVAADGGSSPRCRRLPRVVGGRRSTRRIVGMAAAVDGGGDWEVAADGGIFTSVTPSSTGRWAARRLRRADRGHGGDRSWRHWEVAVDGGVVGSTPLRRSGTGAAGMDRSSRWCRAPGGRATSGPASIRPGATAGRRALRWRTGSRSPDGP